MIESFTSIEEAPLKVKQCAVCGSPMQWRKAYKKPNGEHYYAWRCYPCRKPRQQAYKKENSDRYKVVRRQRYESKAEEIRAARREYYKKNRDKQIEAYQDYRKRNPEKVRESKRKWYHSKGKESCRKTKQKWETNNPGKKAAAARKYNATPEGKLVKRKAFHKRRAAKLGTPHRVTKDEMRKLMLRYPTCIYCGSDDRMTFDHVQPFEHGGLDEISNIVTACKPCNSRKTHLLLEVWAARSGMHVFPMPRLPLIEFPV